jgi:hypothetical protein
MNGLRTEYWVAIGLLCVGVVSSGGRAEFVKVEDFEALELGPIDDQAEWSAAHDTSVVAIDPVDDGNQVLSVATDSTRLYRPAYVLNGTVRMMFLRFRYAEQLNFSYGLSDSVYPSQFGHFEAELSMTSASSDFRVNDDGSYEVLTQLEPDVWYNVWVLVDNENDTTRIWLHDRPGSGAGWHDQLDADGQTVFGFRGNGGDLRTFFIKTGGGSGPSGPLYIDDIYIEDTAALNLWNPTGPRVGDCDGDEDVDLDDYVAFAECLFGPAEAAPSGCGCADADGDADVDLFDFASFQIEFGD